MKKVPQAVEPIQEVWIQVERYGLVKRRLFWRRSGRHDPMFVLAQDVPIRRYVDRRPFVTTSETSSEAKIAERGMTVGAAA